MVKWKYFFFNSPPLPNSPRIRSVWPNYIYAIYLFLYGSFFKFPAYKLLLVILNFIYANLLSTKFNKCLLLFFTIRVK